MNDTQVQESLTMSDSNVVNANSSEGVVTDDRLEESQTQSTPAPEAAVSAATDNTEGTTTAVPSEEAGVPAGDTSSVPVDSAVRIAGTYGLTGKTVYPLLEHITFIQRTIYVENLHATQPNILAVQFRAGGHFKEIIMRIDEETFNKLEALPRFKHSKETRYSYIDDFLQNDPNSGHLLQRTYQVAYPEWITMEDILKQDKEKARYFAQKLSSDLERKLFPDMELEKVKTDNALIEQERAARRSAKATQEVEIEDEFSNPRPTLAEALAEAKG